MIKKWLLFSIMISSLTANPTEVGEAPQNAAQSASNWKNWAFAGGAGLLAGMGIYVVSINQGSTAHQ